MPVDSLNRVITRFKGLHQDVQPWQVPDGGAAGGKNWWVKDGRIEGIPGVGTQTAPATAEVQAIDWYKPRTGNAYLVCVCGGNFYERGSTPTQWTVKTLPALTTADAVSVTVTTTLVTCNTLKDSNKVISVLVDLGDDVHIETEGANKETISKFQRKWGGSALQLVLDASYGGSGAGKLISVPDVLATTGSVAVKQIGNSLMISDGNRPMLSWDGTRLFRSCLPAVANPSDFSDTFAWDYGATGKDWYNPNTDAPYRFRFLWYNEETGEYSLWQALSGANSYYEPTDPTATCGATFDMTAYAHRVPDGATHVAIFAQKSGVTDDDFEFLVNVPVASSVTTEAPDREDGQLPSLYAPGYTTGTEVYWDHPYRPPGCSLRARIAHAHHPDNPIDSEFRRKPPYPLAVHRGIIMGPISGESGVVEGSGWSAAESQQGGINEPWAWGYHNWQVNPSDGEDDITIARAGGRVYFAKENSLYQLDDPSPDPALWGWDKLKVGAGFINAVAEYGGRLWGIVRTRKGTLRIGVFDGKRLIIDPRLGDLTGYDVVAAFGSLLIVGGGATTYILDGETNEWYGSSLATLSAASAAPGDSTYDFYVGKASGAIYGFFTGNAGAFDWQSQAFTFGKPWLRKQYSKVAMGLRAKANLADVQIACRVDGGSWATLETSITLATSLIHWKAGLPSYDGYAIEFRIQSADTTDRLYLEYIEVDGNPFKTDGYG